MGGNIITPKNLCHILFKVVTGSRNAQALTYRSKFWTNDGAISLNGIVLVTITLPRERQKHAIFGEKSRLATENRQRHNDKHNISLC